MTAPHARQPEVLPRPACTPTAIRVVLAACADSDILQRYDEDLDAAFGQARAQGDVTPLVQTVKRWWFEADARRDPKCSGSSSLASTPTEMRVRRDERDDISMPLRSLHFGPAGGGLVTFLVYPPWNVSLLFLRVVTNCTFPRQLRARSL